MVQLIELIGKAKLVRLWKIFLEDPKRDFYQIDLFKTAKLAKATGIKWLRKLDDENLIIVDRRGRFLSYRLSSNPLNKLMKTGMAVSSLLPLSCIEGAEVYLFGSAARGEDTTDSDYDVLVIGKIPKQVLHDHISRLKSKRQVKPVVFTPLEWSAMRTKDPAFYERVEKDKVKLSWM
ncbi:MAG: nucleotidyltransferase domain-containing protein [Nanoarchaeota archaeon]